MAGVVGFLIVSFAIWGIGDIFRGFGRSTVAKVGSVEIGMEQFRQTYNDRLQQLSRRLGKPITPDQARALGLERQIIGQLVAETALDERTRQLHLNLADAEVARQIMSDPNFRGPDGQFDRVRFDQIIRASGYSEPRFAAEQRRMSLRRQLAETITGDVKAPKTAVDAINRYENEQRSIEYVALDRQQAGEVPAPSAEELSKYFDERKTLFRAPEYRKFGLLILLPSEIAKGIEVSDQDARRVYDDHRDRYGIPEKRQVEQIVFPNADEANAAADRIKGGLSFEALATERGLKQQDIDLGLVTKAGMLDKAVADAAFALDDKGTSAPVAGRFGTVLLHVVKIEPGHQRPFEEVAAQIKKELAQERAKTDLLSIHDKVEDERAAGQRLDEIASKLKIPFRNIEAMDRSGRDPKGALVADLPQGIDVVSNVFSTDVGVETDPLQGAGGLVWFDVTGITPSRERSLDEVKDQVEARWRETQVIDRLNAKVADMLDKLKAGTKFSDLAAASELKVETATGLTRRHTPEALSSAVVEAVFRTPKDAPGSAEGKGATDRVVFVVTGITEPPFDPNSAEAKRYSEVVARSLSEDLFGQYVARLQSDLGTAVSEDAIRRVLGGEPD